jgi:hypothetical protein
MIARITYTDSEHGTVTATLSEDALWSADDEDMADTLNALIAAEDTSPARGDWMVWHAEKMAGVLGGTIEAEAKPEPSADTLY